MILNSDWSKQKQNFKPKKYSQIYRYLVHEKNNNEILANQKLISVLIQDEQGCTIRYNTEIND